MSLQSTHTKNLYNQQEVQLTQTDQFIASLHLDNEDQCPILHSQDKSHPSATLTNPQSAQHYFQEHKKVVWISYLLKQQQQKQLEEVQKMLSRVQSIEDNLRNSGKITEFKKVVHQSARNKRSRRAAEEIERKFVCQVEFCERCYGSQGSLQQHIKLKHPEIMENSLGQSHFD